MIKKSAKNILLLNLGLLAFLLVLLELLAFGLYRFPVGDPMLDVARDFYRNHVRRNIQYIPGIGIFHETLGYTLVPTRTSDYSEAEYDTTIRSNTLGFRDDETSLFKPEVIFLGDSHTMGWGVEGEETFASQFEILSGKRGLNLGMPSYGTAREFRSLDYAGLTSDLSNVEAIFIQYCDNDLKENTAFTSQGPDFSTMGPQTYRQVQHIYSEGRRRYYPGKYLRRYLPMLIQGRMKGDMEAQSRDIAQELEHFVPIIKALHQKHPTVPIYIFELSGHYFGEDGFIEALAAQDLPPLCYPLKVASELEADHFFNIDDHINAKGHAKVASQLYQSFSAQSKAQNSTPE